MVLLQFSLSLVVLLCCITSIVLVLGQNNYSICRCDPFAPAPFYDFIPGLGYYKLHTKPKTWIEAKWTCEREGAHLALVKTPKVIDVLQELRRRLPGLHRDWRDDYLWIGVNHISEYGIWETIFGESLTKTALSWDIGEPNGGEKARCGNLVTKVGKLNDGDCNFELGFFCEQEI